MRSYQAAAGDGNPNVPEPVLGRPFTFSSLMEEHDVSKEQRNQRKRLLEKISQPELNDGQQAAVIGHVSFLSLSTADIPVLGNVLLKIGDVHTLNLILDSPGGDGTVVEKVIALCRDQCTKFRVIIPNDAKSAATLIALGADEIVMGPPSELGPIDAQIEATIQGKARYLSAQSFIDARDELVAKHNELVAQGKDTSATLQMMLTLDLAFIVECERAMEFGRDVGKKLLSQYMLKDVPNKGRKVKKVVDTLTSVKQFLQHGRRIDGRFARQELGLNVKLCGQNDDLWRAAWEYYTRAVVALSTHRAFKCFESVHELLMASVPSE